MRGKYGSEKIKGDKEKEESQELRCAIYTHGVLFFSAVRTRVCQDCRKLNKSDTVFGRQVLLAELGQCLTGYDVVLFGEYHNQIFVYPFPFPIFPRQ